MTSLSFFLSFSSLGCLAVSFRFVSFSNLGEYETKNSLESMKRDEPGHLSWGLRYFRGDSDSLDSDGHGPFLFVVWTREQTGLFIAGCRGRGAHLEIKKTTKVIQSRSNSTQVESTIKDLVLYSAFISIKD